MSTVQYRSKMSSSDAIIWNIERDPQLRSTVMAVWVLDCEPTTERMQVNTDRMIAAIPRLRQRVDDRPAQPAWVAVDHVDLAHHAVEIDLGGSADLEDALRFAETWVVEPFDRERPQWRLGLLRGLRGGRAAIVIKVHHAIADGMGMVLMLGAFTDLERDPAPAPPAAPVEPADEGPGREVFTPAHRVVVKAGRALRDLVRGPIDALRRAVRSIASSARLVWPHRRPHSTLMTERSSRRAMEVRTIDLDELKAVSRRTGTTLNDAFVGVLTAAVGRYHAEAGVACPRLRVHIPVNSRTERTADLAGNDFVPARISLAIDRSATTDDHLRAVGEQLAGLRAEPSLHHINTVSALVQRLGRPISRWIIGGMMKGVDVLASNVPGPPFPLYIAGAKIVDFWPFGPPAGAALNVTMFSYDGTARFAFTIDTAAVTDHHRLMACFDAAVADAVDRTLVDA